MRKDWKRLVFRAPPESLRSRRAADFNILTGDWILNGEGLIVRYLRSLDLVEAGIQYTNRRLDNHS
jgi:hypothetical protein